MYIFGKDISEPVYFGVHYLDMYILGNEKLLDVYFRDKPRSLRQCAKLPYLLEYSAPSLEADRAPRGFRSINSTSALSLGIWVSVPESGRRDGLRNQGG